MFKKILVTGSNGFLGHHIVPNIKCAFADAEIICMGRRDFDLLQPDAPAAMLKAIHPDCVIHLAAKSGGIVSNSLQPAEYFYENLQMNLSLFHECWRNGIKKLVTFMGGCSYPANATSPIGEDQMWNGYPQIESAGYSIAKKTLLTQSWAYRKQYNFNSIVLIPGNVYGEWDNFNRQESHVIPALIRKFVEARDNNLKSVTALGSGRPTRDFVYAGDVAATIPWFIANYNESEPVNISAGCRVSIKELTEAIKDVTRFEGIIEWDTSCPDGQMDKIFDVTKLNSLGLFCNTTLREGLQRTADWFCRARQEGTVRL